MKLAYITCRNLYDLSEVHSVLRHPLSDLPIVRYSNVESKLQAFIALCAIHDSILS